MFITLFFILCIINLFNCKNHLTGIIGANGKTGQKLVELYLNNNKNIRALTRTGYFNTSNLNITNENYLLNIDISTADVTNPVELNQAFKNVHTCIFVASTSKNGGTPKEVDENGLINVANMCIKNKVKKLIVISSMMPIKKTSMIGTLMNNIFGNKIKKAKYNGEEAIRNIYNKQIHPHKCVYTIIRPGKLIDLNNVNNINEIELNQLFDNKYRNGIISRNSLAELCYECDNDMHTDNCTFECYYKGSKTNIFNRLKHCFDKNKKQINNTSSYKSSYKELFHTLKTDYDLNHH